MMKLRCIDMEYPIDEDINTILELLDIPLPKLAEELNINCNTLFQWKTKQIPMLSSNLESLYEYAYANKLRLNNIHAQILKETRPQDHILLFHGAKQEIQGAISLEKSKRNNDFGPAFYCGENMEQAAMFVSTYDNSCLYMVDFDLKNKKSLTLGVEQDWMFMIAYFRGRLTEYSSHPIIQKLLQKLDGIDYVIAPIADNRMFQIIDSFIEGEITDVQCQHCLSATNLGNQYVFLTQKAIDSIMILRRCYLTKSEKENYLKIRSEDFKISDDKVKLARRQFRKEGNYIEDILS